MFRQLQGSAGLPESRVGRNKTKTLLRSRILGRKPKIRPSPSANFVSHSKIVTSWLRFVESSFLCTSLYYVDDTLTGAVQNAQMLNLRSLAAILYSAIRFSRAAFLRSPLRSKALISAQKMATNMAINMATNMATNRAASMSVSYQQSTPKNSDGKTSALSSSKTQSTH